MTMPDERYRAVMMAKELLEDLLSSTKTPRVPKLIRSRARGCLRHFPSEWEMKQLAQASPDLIAEKMEPLYRMVKQYELTKEENESK